MHLQAIVLKQLFTLHSVNIVQWYSPNLLQILVEYKQNSNMWREFKGNFEQGEPWYADCN